MPGEVFAFRLFSVRARRLIGLAVLFAFLSFVPLPASDTKPISCVWTDVRRVIVVGDLHGDYDNFIAILRGTGLVDDELHWSAGNTHFVQTGDIMDRGPDARKIMDVLMRLEPESEAAGGMVHVLIGNHEELNIGGVIFRYPDYITAEQFISFLPDKYRHGQEVELEKRTRLSREKGSQASPESLAAAFWNSLKNDPGAQRQYLAGFNAKYGDWLLGHNIVIMINDTVYVHGGLSEKYSLWPIQKLNERYRLELADMQRGSLTGRSPGLIEPEIVYKGDSPLWYRDLATVPEQDLSDEVDRILAHLGARHLVIAHTPRTAVTINQMRRFGGRVWIVDTGISKAYNDNLSALKIIDGVFIVWSGSHEETDNTGLGVALSSFLCWRAGRRARAG